MEEVKMDNYGKIRLQPIWARLHLAIRWASPVHIKLHPFWLPYTPTFSFKFDSTVKVIKLLKN